MKFMGIIALTLGIVCVLDTTFVYGYPFITSISESATIGNKTGMLLPFALGCMFTFCFSYVGYNETERSLVHTMGYFFLLVAMQICASPYVTENKVGLLGLRPVLSNSIHSISAIIGFGLMWIWVMFFFTKSTPNGTVTRQKRMRNKLYYTMGILMFFGFLLLILGRLGAFRSGFPYTWLAEEFILIPAGIAILVKSGVFLRDKR
ncbi:MAG: hypothetical protein LBM28_04420 [Oscillospiraceae bacterium]|nr:hypothetical protein [Oscillospiraceae bacterium]